MKTIQRFREAIDWLFLKAPFIRRAAEAADHHRRIREACESLDDLSPVGASEAGDHPK